MRSTRPDLGLWKYLAFAVVGLAAITLWGLNRQALGFQQDSYKRCVDRQTNVNIANTLYARLTVDALKIVNIEAHNRYVNQKIRDQRTGIWQDMADAWSGVIFVQPHCGPKP